jgi:F-type H+-transporting ATPase subunit epsilon
MALRLSVVTPERALVETEADSVVAPGAEGEFGVLPGHAPFLAPLRAGVVSWTSNGRSAAAAVSGGFAEVSAEGVTLLARTAELAEAIDRERAERALARAREKLASAERERAELAAVEAAASRARARLEAHGR